MGRKLKLDANEQLFFSRQLEFIERQTYDIRYPGLKARELIPVSSEVPEGAKTITYRQYDMVGMAKIVANYATDFPRVTVKGKEFTSPVKRLGDSYEYSEDDIKAAMLAGIDLDGMEAAAAKRAILQKENSIAFFGDADTGLPGFLSNANIPEAAAAADGAGGLSTWASKTPDQIIRDVTDMIESIPSVTNGVEEADTVVFPKNRWNVLKKRIPDLNMTILQFLMQVHPEITLWTWLNELNDAGVGSTAEMVAYKRDPMFLKLHIPLDFTQYEPQVEGLNYKIPCSSKTGGTVIYYPLSATLVYGI